MRNLSDEFDDIFDEIRKFLKEKSNLFDIDFRNFPEFIKDLDIRSDKKNIRGFKVSYRFEPGMDKPEIKIEGDIDEKKLNDYLKNINLKGIPRLNNLLPSKSKKEIDAKELSLEPCAPDDDECTLEPHTQISDFDEFTEIIIEVPGIKKEDIKLSFSDEGRKMTFSAQNKSRKYLKHIHLPFNSSIEDYILEVNNGIATLRVKRQNN